MGGGTAILKQATTARRMVLSEIRQTIPESGKTNCNGCNSWREHLCYTFQDGDLWIDCAQRKYRELLEEGKSQKGVTITD
jgi:hypothetical protein